jgi:hypothetical protein
MIGYFLAMSTDESKFRIDIIPCNPDSKKDEAKCIRRCELEHFAFGYCGEFEEHHICVCFN